MALTDFAENKVQGALFGGAALGAPATWYIALFTAAPNDAGGGTEVTGGAYARVAVTNDQTTGFNAPSGGLVDNKNAINFPTPTAGWGTVTHVGKFDASSGGNLWEYVALTASKTINIGDIVSFAAGAFDSTAD